LVSAKILPCLFVLRIAYVSRHTTSANLVLILGAAALEEEQRRKRNII
jgi:hypothetical protein